MSRLTRRVRSDVPPMILKLLNLEEVPTECIEVVGTNSKPCDEVCGENQCSSCVLSAVFEKLAHYEDLEEQGLLLELPCKVGDTVWIITEDQYRSYCYAYPVVVDWIKQTQYVTSFGRWDSGMVKEITFHIDDFGKTVFLTKEEAEAKLKELQGVSK